MSKSGTSFLDRWRAFAAEFGLDADTREELGSELLVRHREAQRHYHTDAHVVDVLRQLEFLNAPSEPTAVQALAAFFHDAIYDPERSDNEAQSAAWMQEQLAPFALPELADATTIILATATHVIPDEAPAGTATFLDADLSILGSEPARYQAYAEQIRAEYSHIPDADYRSGRARVLEAFLERPFIYHTKRAREFWEDAARRNVTGECSALRGP